MAFLNTKIFNEISLNNKRGDIFGGVTAAVIALPMALAFGVASGAGAEAGLYGAIMVGLFAALWSYIKVTAAVSDVATTIGLQRIVPKVSAEKGAEAVDRNRRHCHR